MWSRTNTLKITLELVRNAGETLVQTYSLGMRSGSVPRVLQKPHESRPENEARTGSAAHATHDMVSGQQPAPGWSLLKDLHTRHAHTFAIGGDGGVGVTEATGRLES